MKTKQYLGNSSEKIVRRLYSHNRASTFLNLIHISISVFPRLKLDNYIEPEVLFFL